MNIPLKEVNWEGWDTLMNYNKALAAFENEPFLSMKGNRLFEFQDACNAWQDKIKTMERNQQIAHISKELELFRNIFPLLKQLSSNIFEKDHWRVFYGIAKIDKDRAPDKMKLRELLNVGKTLLDKSNDIKELLSRAQGETTIRDAIQ